MGITWTKTWSSASDDGVTVLTGDHLSNIQTDVAGKFTTASGGIANADVYTGAGIVDTKLAQITTASKVTGGAIAGTPFSDGYIFGYELTTFAVDATTVVVKQGVMIHGITKVRTVEPTTLVFATAGDWWDDAADTYGSDGWNYIGVDTDGLATLLGDQAPDVSSYTTDSTQGDTTGTLIYFWDGTNDKHWRVIGAVRIESDDQKTQWGQMQSGNMIMLDIPQNLTTTISAGSWTDGSDQAKGLCSALIPAISTMGIFGLQAVNSTYQSTIYIRPKGATWAINHENSIHLRADVGADSTEIAGQRWCGLDDDRKIEHYQIADTTAMSIDVEGYVLNIR